MCSASIPSHVIKTVCRLVNSLHKKGFRVDKVYLFGSYAKGTWLKTSDIDVVIVSRDFKGIDFVKRLDIINEIIWREKIEPYIEVLPYTEEELRERITKSIVLRDASRYWIHIDCINEGKCG